MFLLMLMLILKLLVAYFAFDWAPCSPATFFSYETTSGLVICCSISFSVPLLLERL